MSAGNYSAPYMKDFGFMLNITTKKMKSRNTCKRQNNNVGFRPNKNV